MCRPTHLQLATAKSAKDAFTARMSTSSCPIAVRYFVRNKPIHPRGNSILAETDRNVARRSTPRIAGSLLAPTRQPASAGQKPQAAALSATAIAKNLAHKDGPFNELAISKLNVLWMAAVKLHPRFPFSTNRKGRKLVGLLQNPNIPILWIFSKLMTISIYVPGVLIILKCWGQPRALATVELKKYGQ
jgi:hypothetical protein